jgi:hypothetical protein
MRRIRKRDFSVIDKARRTNQMQQSRPTAGTRDGLELVESGPSVNRAAIF